MNIENRVEPGHPPRETAVAAHGRTPLQPLAALALEPWRLLAERVIEPNGYYLPDWELAINASAPGRTGVFTLTAWRKRVGTQPAAARDLIASCRWCLPGLPTNFRLPPLVSADPYGTLGTPPIHREFAAEAIGELMQQARAAGARALILRNMSLDGPAMTAFTDVLSKQKIAPQVLQFYSRACLDATRDANELLHDALGPKKLKELRRQRNRLAEHGEVKFSVARNPADVAADLEVFLALEASGWKAKRGTALSQNAGDATFIRRATRALAELGQCEIVTLRAGATPVAGAIVLRHLSRAFYFKIGIDERFAKLSPGVQLTLDLTRHLCADHDILSADSTANAGHPMIDPIWRGRITVGDVIIPLRPRDPMVAVIHAALVARIRCRDALRHGLHAVRKLTSRDR